jgi:ferredoxin--NADP+ reductase
MKELNSFVSQVIQVSPIMKIFRITPDGWELPKFEAGQFVALYLPGSASRCEEATAEYKEQAPEKMIKRAYSIASSSNEQEYLEFYITLVHSGSLTPRLFDLKIGDRVGMGQKITGMFTLDAVPAENDVILVATGTGVAPYMSMIRTDILKKQRKITVIHGATNSWDLGYSSELRLMESMFDNFSYIPTILEPEKEPTQWTGETDFVQNILKRGEVEKIWGHELKPNNTHIFLCGNPNMIDSVVEVMGEKGFTEHSRRNPGQIHVEKF